MVGSKLFEAMESALLQFSHWVTSQGGGIFPQGVDILTGDSGQERGG